MLLLLLLLSHHVCHMPVICHQLLLVMSHLSCGPVIWHELQLLLMLMMPSNDGHVTVVFSQLMLPPYICSVFLIGHRLTVLLLLPPLVSHWFMSGQQMMMLLLLQLPLVSHVPMTSYQLMVPRVVNQLTWRQLLSRVP